MGGSHTVAREQITSQLICSILEKHLVAKHPSSFLTHSVRNPASPCVCHFRVVVGNGSQKPAEPGHSAENPFLGGYFVNVRNFLYPDSMLGASFRRTQAASGLQERNEMDSHKLAQGDRPGRGTDWKLTSEKPLSSAVGLDL